MTVVTQDSVGPSSSGASVLSNGTLSWTHIVGSGINRALYVGVVLGASVDTMTTSVTYGGVAMASIGKVHADNTNAGYVQLFRLLSPAVGSASVVVTCSAAPVSLAAGSVSYFNVSQANPDTVTTAFGSSANPAITESVGTGDMAISLVGCGSPVISTTNTQLWLNNASSATGCGNGAMSQDASGVMSWTVNSDFWGIIGADIHLAPPVTYYRYTPPSWRYVTQMESALRVGHPVCTLVYRSGGVWHNQMQGYPNNPDLSTVDTDDSGLLLFFYTPTVIPDTLLSALSALTQADPSWTAASFAPL